MGKKITTGILAAVLCVALLGCGRTKPSGAGEWVSFTPFAQNKRVADTRRLSNEDYTRYMLSGVDDFDRTFTITDGEKEGKRYVGMFYFLWLGFHSNSQNAILDMNKLPLEDFQQGTADSVPQSWHHWGESVFGYYNSNDEWVMRKQVEMFVMMGLDFLVFDCTNGYTYDATVTKLLGVLKEYAQDGWDVPQVMYYLHTDGKTGGQLRRDLKRLYTDFYKKAEYEGLWFAPNGKPLAVLLPTDTYYYNEDGNYGFDMTDAVEAEMRNYFEFRCSQWPDDAYDENGVPWMDFGYPQRNHGGWMNVSVAQHPSLRFTDTVGTHGRGWNGASNKHDAYKQDTNFAKQWQTVLEWDPAQDYYGYDAEYVFVTGWNEWVAQKQGDTPGEYWLVDTYNAEYSRDIEPSVNNGDNTFMLCTADMRAYKYTQAKHYVYPQTAVDFESDDAAWQALPVYKDLVGDCRDRNAAGFISRQRYTDTSGRNDIAGVQITHDDTYLYMRVTAAEDITPFEAGDAAWMNVWLKTRNARYGAMGYNYVLNRTVDGNRSAIYKADGKGNFVDSGRAADVRTSGNTMFLRVKLADLGLSAQNYDIECKVTDNCDASRTGNYLDLYRSGDCAPCGRLNYHYGF